MIKMRPMKSCLARLVAAAAGWAALACPLAGLAGPLKVVTSFYPMYVHALNVAGGVEGVVVENLTEPITGCLHDFQLTTVHMRRLADADVLAVNGGGMESFLEKVIAQRPGLKIVDASRGIEFLENAGGQGHDHDEGEGGRGHGDARTKKDAEHGHDHGHGHDHREVNPHVWVSPELAIRQVWNIADGLAAIDQAHATAYRANAEAYAGKLEALRKRMGAELGSARGKRVVTFHEAFPYFAREFGLEIAAVVQRDPGAEPSPRELAETIDLVKASKVVAVFAEPQYPASGADAIRRETGVRFGVLDPVVTGPEGTGAARDAYLRAMEKNLLVLKEALQ